MSNRSLKVLIIAEHASAKFGGEAILPLHYFRFLRKRGVEAWLLVHARTRDELSQAIPAEDQERVIYVPDTKLHISLWKLGRRLPKTLANITTGAMMHLLTQVLQRRLARDLVKHKSIDVVHEPIPVSPKQPSLMSSLGAPVVIGPMNGGMSYPPAFQDMQSSVERRLIVSVRAASSLINRCISGKRQAALLLVANERTQRALPSSVRVPVAVLVENAVDLSVWQRPDQTESPKPNHEGRVKFIYMGRMERLKAIDILLDAFAMLCGQTLGLEFSLDLLGDGPERTSLEQQAARLDLVGKVHFRGFLTQSECARYLADADALLMPSLHECGGAVVLEAMALSKPVVATNWGGPADYLDATCGILVDPTGREELVAGFAQAMENLALFPNLRQQMGRAGRAKIESEYDWERKIDRILEIYQDVSKNRASSL